MTSSRFLLVGLAALASALAVTALPAGKARAFTYESANGVSADGSSNLTDPDSRFDSMSKGNSTTLPGGVTMQFGPQNSQGPTEQDYQTGVNRMFNPLGSPGN